jgi:hypothetical protein
MTKAEIAAGSCAAATDLVQRPRVRLRQKTDIESNIGTKRKSDQPPEAFDEERVHRAEATVVDGINRDDNDADFGTRNINLYMLMRFMKVIDIGYFVTASPLILFVGYIITQATLAAAPGSDIGHADSHTGLMDDHWQFGLFEFMMITWLIMFVTIWRLTRTSKETCTPSSSIGIQTDDATPVVPARPIAVPDVPKVYRSRRAGEVQHLFRNCGHIVNLLDIEETVVCKTCIKQARVVI